MHSLRVSVTWLDPFYHGMICRGNAPEWPPSPWRLFGALLQGTKIRYRKAWGSDQESAFRWFEAQAPPVIIAPPAHPGKSYMMHMLPTNDHDFLVRDQLLDLKSRENPRKLHSEKIMRPTVIDGPSTVHYVWAVSDTDLEVAARIVHAAGYLSSLGHGIDKAYAYAIIENGEVDLAGIRWWPCPAYFGQTRVPKAGALDNFEEGWRRSGRLLKTGDIGWRPTCFHNITYVPDYASLPRHFAAFWILDEAAKKRADGLREWPVARCTGLAAAVRKLAEEAAVEDGLDEAWIRRFITGHVEKGDHDRLSYMCLPTTGGNHLDGMVRRVLVAEPFGGTGVHSRWLKRRLAGKVIRNLEGRFAGRLEPIPLADPSDGILGLYFQPSQRWASVTPVVLPGKYTDYDGMLNLVKRSFDHAGLPYPAAFRIVPRPPWGGAHLPRYVRKEDVPEYLRGVRQVHVEVEFSRPMYGPISLGSGRHVGLGVLAGLDNVPLSI